MVQSTTLSNIEESGSWTALMEAQFLLDIVGNTLDNDEVTSSADANNDQTNDIKWSAFQDARGPLTIPPSVSTPQWSLTIRAEDNPCCPEDQGPTSNDQRVIKNRKNQNKLKEKWKLKKHLPLESFYQSPEDWEDLHLMRKMMGGKGQSSDSETSTEADSDDSTSDMEGMKGKVKFDPITAYKKPKKPTEEIIRKKVLEIRNLVSKTEINKDNSLDLDALGSLHSHCDPVLAETRKADLENIADEAAENMEATFKPEYVDEADETGRTIVPKTVYNFSKRKFEAEKDETRKVRRRKTVKFVRWYERQPFEDPVLEAKRLRALKAKINHDKHRLDLDNLKTDARELKDENSSLKEELIKFKQREAELTHKLADKEATEVRLKELERELKFTKQNEEALQSQLKQLGEPQKLVVQVDGFTTRERSAGK